MFYIGPLVNTAKISQTKGMYIKRLSRTTGFTINLYHQTGVQKVKEVFVRDILYFFANSIKVFITIL